MGIKLLLILQNLDKLQSMGMDKWNGLLYFKNIPTSDYSKKFQKSLQIWRTLWTSIFVKKIQNTNRQKNTCAFWKHEIIIIHFSDYLWKKHLVNPLFIVLTFIWLGFLRKVLMTNNNYHKLHKSLLRYTEDIRRNQHHTAFITACLNLNEFPKGLKI